MGHNLKKIDYMVKGVETRDGAGVKLKRIFGGPNTVNITDPFLLLDHFGSDKIEDYIAGFPWHPHRGIETVTYLLSGKVVHSDSTGHKGTIYPDELQWMTAGSGIFHQEMPEPLDEKNPEELMKAYGMPTLVSGFQLWLNLPAKYKMTTPAYRSIKGNKVPKISIDGATVKIIAGEYNKVEGIYNSEYGIDPLYLDILMDEESEFAYKIKNGYTSIIFSITGEGMAGNQSLEPDTAAIMSRDNSYIKINTGKTKYRFILLSGKPLNEPVKWFGPIVMNTDEQIREAIKDLNSNNFVREKVPLIK
ncbi:pirin family protein [Ferroplasma sp.]|uniref:pirin family protein n=1 Tax=Ferroplasma sp. TaxID=2591003 RepID=UPI00307EEA04